MKTNNLIYKALSLVALLCLGQTMAWTQQITDYSRYTIRHKQAKWYNLRATIGESAKALDTFNDDEKMFRNEYNGTEIQAAHTYYDTLYVRKGEDVTLTLPVVSQSYNGSSNIKVSDTGRQAWNNLCN